MSKCPKCEQTFAHVNLAECQVRYGIKSWIGVSYNCPHCGTSLSVGIDHIAFGNEIAAKVVDQLKKHR